MGINSIVQWENEDLNSRYFDWKHQEVLIELWDFWALYVMIFVFYFLGEKTLYVKVKLLLMFVIGCYGFTMSIQRQLMISVQEGYYYLK